VDGSDIRQSLADGNDPISLAFIPAFGEKRPFLFNFLALGQVI